MQRENEKDRKITCKYDPIEVKNKKKYNEHYIIEINKFFFSFLGWRLSNKCKMVW